MYLIINPLEKCTSCVHNIIYVHSLHDNDIYFYIDITYPITNN